MSKPDFPMPIGAAVTENGTHFRVWAPDRRQVAVLLDRPVALEPEGNGYFSALVPGVGAGTRYVFQLDDDAANAAVLHEDVVAAAEHHDG